MLSICAAFPGLIGRKFHCATEFILMFELQKPAEPIDHFPDNLHWVLLAPLTGRWNPLWLASPFLTLPVPTPLLCLPWRGEWLAGGMALHSDVVQRGGPVVMDHTCQWNISDDKAAVAAAWFQAASVSASLHRFTPERDQWPPRPRWWLHMHTLRKSLVLEKHARLLSLD